MKIDTSTYTKATTSYNKIAKDMMKASSIADSGTKDVVAIGANKYDAGGVTVGKTNNITILRKGDDITLGAAQAINNDRSSFFNFLTNTVASKFGAIKKAEQKSTNAVDTDESMIEVMAAVNEASIALDQVVAVRDKFVTSYTELMRMAL